MNEVREVAAIVRDLGFPIFISCWLLMKLGPKIDSLASEITKLVAKIGTPIFLLVMLTGCSAMQAGRYDGDHGTPFAHAPTSANPVDWAGYLYVMLATLATREAAPHAVRALKKKEPVKP